MSDVCLLISACRPLGVTRARLANELVGSPGALSPCAAFFSTVCTVVRGVVLLAAQ